MAVPLHHLFGHVTCKRHYRVVCGLTIRQPGHESVPEVVQAAFHIGQLPARSSRDLPVSDGFIGRQSCSCDQCASEWRQYFAGATVRWLSRAHAFQSGVRDADLFWLVAIGKHLAVARLKSSSDVVLITDQAG